MIGGRFGCEGTLLNRAKLDKFFINLKNRKSFCDSLKKNQRSGETG